MLLGCAPHQLEASQGHVASGALASLFSIQKHCELS